MKSEKGITLTSLVIYIVVATIVIGTMAIVSSFFFSNMNLIKNQDQYAIEFNKFNMFFINDVKKNKTAQVQNNQIVFEDGTTYQYSSQEQKIYRNNEEIAKQVQSLNFTTENYQVANTTKILINVEMSIGDTENFNKTIQYVLKYW